MTTIDEQPRAVPPTTMSIALKWGLISTAATILIFIVRVIATKNPMENSWVWSVIGLGLGVVLLVLAQREYKTNGDGFMSYGKGFMIGFLMGIISIVAYGIFLYIYATFIDAGLMDLAFEPQRLKMEEQGMSEEQIQTGMKFGRMLFWPILLVGGIIMNCIFVLIVTIFTQKPNPNPGI
ncbi:MAG: DUF4199 domain-containing protein [Bacteroidota bacterium]